MAILEIGLRAVYFEDLPGAFVREMRFGFAILALRWPFVFNITSCLGVGRPRPKLGGESTRVDKERGRALLEA